MVFGTAALAFGIVSSFGHDAARALGIVEALAGAALLCPRTARGASIALGVLYAIFALMRVGGIVRAPGAYTSYGDVFEQLAVLCGAAAVYAATAPDTARAALPRAAARIGLGLCAISFATAQIVYLTFTASLVPAWIPPSPLFWVALTTAAFVLAGGAAILDRQTRLALRLLALMLGLFGALVWAPRLVARPAARGDWSEFAETVLIAGAAWVVAEL